MKRLGIALAVVVAIGSVTAWRLSASSSGGKRRAAPLTVKSPVVSSEPSTSTTTAASSSATSSRPATSTSGTPPTTALPNGFQAGISVVYYARQVSDPTTYVPPLLDQLGRDHVDAVSIVFPVYTDSVTANSIHSGPDTPSDDALSYLAGQAHSRGMSVMLRPLLDEANLPSPEWRGTLRPASVAAWFDSYQSLVVHYARLASNLHVETLNIGSELNSMEAYPDSWRTLIRDVKGVFGGQVTYAANWQGYSTSFWGALDFVSFDAYFPLDAASASVPDLVSAWRPALQQVRQALAPYRKPVVFTEVGVQSRVDAYRRPWVRNPNAPVDLAEQSAYYTATCQATNGIVKGLFWWGVYLKPPANPLNDGDYTPLGKPAENALRSCYTG